MEDFFDRFQAFTGVSRYSNAEVITPLNIVKDMVDLLPTDVFNPDAKFLDPAVKSGRFLAEIYRRLFDSPLLSHMNEADRRQHILTNQLYGLATSSAAATIVRKQLYDDPLEVGNIVYMTGKKHSCQKQQSESLQQNTSISTWRSLHGCGYIKDYPWMKRYSYSAEWSTMKSPTITKPTTAYETAHSTSTPKASSQRLFNRYNK